MIISLMAAASENNAIGKDNRLMWSMSADLKYFKKVTSNHHVVMGRKTFESFGKKLPKRTNIIVTRNINYEAEGCLVVDSLDKAIDIAKESGEHELFIIGGGEIYKQAINFADRIYLTRIHAKFDADTFFPDIDPGIWQIVRKEEHNPDVKNPYPYDFLVYERKK